MFFIAPGPLVFDLFERGFDVRMATWLGVVLVGTASPGCWDSSPGCEPRPYIIRFTEDRPNPLYRRICYTTAWGEVVAFAVLNIAGLAYATATGEWRLKQMYEFGYFPLAGTTWLLGALGYLPRVRASTKGEGHERRYFYGSVWAVACAQPVLWLLWKSVPRRASDDGAKLRCFSAFSSPSGTWRDEGGCRERVQSCRASGLCRTSRREVPRQSVTATIDALTSPTLKHLREAWWDDEFTAFLAETLKPRPGNRILDVGCGEGLAEVAIGRLHISQVRLVGVDLARLEGRHGKAGDRLSQSARRVRGCRCLPAAVSRRRVRLDLFRCGASACQRRRKRCRRNGPRDGAAWPRARCRAR